MSQIKFRMQGVCCPNCAQRIADECARLPHVDSAEQDFATQQLQLRVRDSADTAVLQTQVRQIVQNHEPKADVALSDRHAEGASAGGNSEQAEPSAHAEAQGHELARGWELNRETKLILVRWAIGLVLLLVGLRFAGALRIGLHTAAWLIVGYDVLLAAGKSLLRQHALDENVLMTIATLGALAVGETAEAVGVMLFYQLGEAFQEMAVHRSRRSITELMDVRPDEVRLLDGSIVNPEGIPVGTHIRTLAGERIAMDGVVLEGSAQLDTMALTGESLPRDVAPGDEVLAGCINLNGTLVIDVTKPFAESAVSRTLALVEEAALKKAPVERFITRFARVYTPVVIVLAALIAVVPPLLFAQPFATWLYRGLLFLVVSCPCALVLSTPLGFFAGIGSASRQGILIKGGQAIEALAKASVVGFDKTGTLTKGRFALSAAYPQPGVSEEALLQASALAESQSTHPVAKAIREAAQQRGLRVEGKVSAHTEIAGQGVTVEVDGRQLAAGNARLMERFGIRAQDGEDVGTQVHIAKDGRYLGVLVVCDVVKEDAAEAVRKLKALGIRKTVMLTGDQEAAAKKVAALVGVDEAQSGLLPEDKLKAVEKLKAEIAGKGSLVYVGDGINDAPVLAMADVGISMGQMGSDAAIEAADVVLMTDQPTRLPRAIEISRRTVRIVRENIVFALACKGIVLVLSAMGLTNMWLAVFADVGVALLAVLNSLRAMRYKA